MPRRERDDSHARRGRVPQPGHVSLDPALRSVPAALIVNDDHLLDALPDAVVVLDVDRRITAVNDAALVLLRRADKELVGALADEVLDPRTRDGKRVWANGWPSAVRLATVWRIPEQEIDVLRGSGRPGRGA